MPKNQKSREPGRKLHSKQPQQLSVWGANRQVSTMNSRPGTLLPYLPRTTPGNRYVVYIMLVPGVWFHSRPSSWGARDTLSTPQSRSEPKLTCWGAVCVGADWSLSSFPPTPTATSQKKRQNKLRTALECIPSRAITI